MLPTMTTRYHDSGILALGFSAAVLIDAVTHAFAIPGAPDHHATLARVASGARRGSAHRDLPSSQGDDTAPRSCSRWD